MQIMPYRKAEPRLIVIPYFCNMLERQLSGKRRLNKVGTHRNVLDILI
jgi:hypothetical protein